MKNTKISILAFTDKGMELAETISNIYAARIFDGRSGSAKEYLASAFSADSVILFIGAAGIATRLVAPLIKSKDSDPAVIVIDEAGHFAIPVLSGHIGGGNEFCIDLCREIGAVPVITTATDINRKLSIDVWLTKHGCKIADISKIKHLSKRILKDMPVGFYSDLPFSEALPYPLTQETCDTGVCISTDDTTSPFETTLNAVPQIISLGVGCKKNTSAEDFENFILKQLKNCHISLLAVKQIASIDLKSKEECILSFSKKYGIPFVTYTKEQLNSLSGEFTGSAFVKSITGVDNICERSAFLASNMGKIILAKTAECGITLSIAKEDWKYKL